MKYLVLQGRQLTGRDGSMLGMSGDVVSDTDPNFPTNFAPGCDAIRVADDDAPVAPAAEEPAPTPSRFAPRPKPRFGEDEQD